MIGFMPPIVIKKTLKVWKPLGSSQLLFIELLLEAGGFARAFAHEVKLGTSDYTVAFDHYFVDARGAKQESALHANTVGCHTADGDGLIVTTLAGTDDGAFEFLDTLAVAFSDLDMHADAVTGFDLGDIFVFLGLESLHDVWHCLSSLPLNVFIFRATADYSTHFRVLQAGFRKSSEHPNQGCHGLKNNISVIRG